MGKIAFVFPGQGSQKPGMGQAFYQASAAVRGLFDQANEILGFDLGALCFNGPEDVLRSTENAQPALYVVSVAAAMVLKDEARVLPESAAGHSVGEYAALTVAGVLDFGDGVSLVRKRAELMRDAALASPGTMLAVLGLNELAVRDICRTAQKDGGVAAVANVNGAGQIVISGTVDAMERASGLAKEAGARKVIPLAVSGPFHSPLMVTAGDALFHVLAETPLRKPGIPIVCNVTAEYFDSPADVMAGLTRQVSGSVLWEQSVQKLIGDGCDTFVEAGCGEVLCGLIRRIDKSCRTFSVQSPEDAHVVAAKLHESTEQAVC